MIALLIFLVRLLVLPYKPKRRLEAENAALRRQVAVLQRTVRGRTRLANSDRLFFVLLYRWFPSILKTMTVIKPETLVRWHRAGFRRYWRWKSRNLGGRPPISAELRALIRRMSLENTLWGAPHIHGELLKLGFTVAQSTVAKYMAKKRDDPSGQSWSTFLRNHMPHIATIDLFVVPTIGFRLLYALVIVRLARRELVWTNVTAHPTADWIAQQITEAFPWAGLERFHVSQRGLCIRSIGRIDKHGNASGSRHKLAQESQSLCGQLANEKVDACQVAARPGEAGHKTEPDRVFAYDEDDGDRRGCRLGRERHSGASVRGDHHDLPANQLGRQRRQPVKLVLGPAVFNRHVLALDIAGVFQALAKCAQLVRQYVVG
jgi:hypothetical protein